MDQAGDHPDAAAGEKPRGIFGRVFGGGGKRYKAAKMGKQLEMYYNEKLKCWVLPGEEEAKEKEVTELTAPPPKSMSMSHAPSASQEDAGSAASNGNSTKPPGGLGGQPIYGGARGTSRYASASSFSISTAENGGAAAAPQSLLSGLKPPSSFGGLPGGNAAAPAVFKPMAPAPAAIEEEEATTHPGAAPVAVDRNISQQESTGDTAAAPEDAGDSQYDNNQHYNDSQQQQQQQQHQDLHPQQEQQHFYENKEITANATAPAMNTQQTQNTSSSQSAAISDPVVLEVLSFWSYYRNCGYDADAMAEWVGQNYDPEYGTLNINYEEMLLNSDISAAVEQHISDNKNTDARDVGDVVASGGGGDGVLGSEPFEYKNKKESNIGVEGGGVGGTTSEMMVEDALVAEQAGEYIPPTSQYDDHQRQYAYNGETAAAAAAGGAHLPGAESGWSGYDDGFEVEGGGTATTAATGGDVHAASDFPAEFGGGEAGDATDDYAVDATYVQYDQYGGQYYTTDQYHIEETQTAVAGATGEEGRGENAFDMPAMPLPPPAAAAAATATEEREQDPTLGQVIGNMFHQHPQQQAADGTTAAGQIASAIGGTLKGLVDEVANVGTTMDQQQRVTDEQVLPLQEDQWGYTTPAAGPSPARKSSNDHRGGGGVGGHPRFPVPPGGQQQQLSSVNDGGAAGVHPIFSPGQLAADLGVPKEAVSMSALFAAEGASVGTLSSRESEDGWSDGGDLVGIVPGGGEGTAVGVEEVEREQQAALAEGGAAQNGGAVREEEEGTSMVLQQQPPQIENTATASPSQIDVVGPWEAAAAAIEATASGTASDAPPPPPQPPLSSSQSGYLPTAPPPDAAVPVVGMETKSTQADAIGEGAFAVAAVDDSQYKAALLEMENLREQLQVASTAAETATADLERSKEEAAVQSATLAEAMGARDAALHEKHALEEQIESLKSDVAQVPALLEKCSTLETAAAEQSSSFADLKTKLSMLAEERDDLAAKLAEAETRDAGAAAAAGELAVLQLDLEEAKEALEARENECEDLKAALELKDDAIVELRAQEMKINEAKKEELASMERRFESEISSIRGELSAAQVALAAADDAAADKVAAAVEDARARMQDAIGEVVEEKNAELERLEREWMEERTQHASQISSVESLLTEKDSEIMELRAQLATQTAESEAAAAAASANLAAAVAAATGDISASKEAELEAAQTRVKELEKKFVLAKKKIATQLSQQEQLTAEVDNLKAQLEGASTGHNAELSEMAQALEEAVAAQQAITTEATALQSRLKQLQATKEEEIQALAADNSQIVQMIGERDSLIESLSHEIEVLREQNTSLTASIEAEKGTSTATAANDTVIQQLQADLDAAKEDLSQWAAVAEDADARCTAAEEALAGEEAAREEAANAVVQLQEDMAVLKQALASTEAQCNELVAMQEQATTSVRDGRGDRDHDGFGNDDSSEQEQRKAEVIALRQRVSELESDLTLANQTLHSLDRGGFEDAVEEVGELRTRLAAASQVAAAKEDELLKYKKQLVKAKKLRNSDLEKIAALEQQKQQQQQQQSSGDGGAAAAAGDSIINNSSTALEISSLREELSSLQEQLAALRAASAETDEGLNEALSALGTEELKVARMVELLIERGVEENVLEEELNAVEEMVMMDGEEQGEGDGGVQQQEEREESLV